MKLICKLALALTIPALFLSCKTKATKKVIIWTSHPEFVSYSELFNATHNNVKAVVIYKDEVARALPPAKDEIKPDIIIGSWLKNSSTRKFFQPLDYMFQEGTLSRPAFYSQLIQYGSINEKQYLLPVSFNLPLMIFNKKNEVLIGTEHTLNLEQIKNVSGSFNKQTKTGTFTSMGYAPSWDPDFIYLASRMGGSSYFEKGISFIYDKEALKATINNLRNWTTEKNKDTTTEQNFQFKYLYMPKYKQVTTGRCLLASTTSNYFFTLNDAQSSNISFRWIEQNSKIPVEEDLITMGIYKNALHTNEAEKFIAWFMKSETQETLIKRNESMNLDTVKFGIANGFSSIKEVNEKSYPASYRQLLGNLPPEESISLPNILPARWESLKSRVILPFLVDSTNTSVEQPELSLEDRISEWTKQYY